MRGLAPTTQRSYLHYVAEYAKYYNIGPEKLDLEAIRQYELYMLHERKLSPQSVNTFIRRCSFSNGDAGNALGEGMFSALRTGNEAARRAVAGRSGIFFRHVASLKHRAALMLCYGAGLRISEAVNAARGFAANRPFCAARLKRSFSVTTF